MATNPVTCCLHFSSCEGKRKCKALALHGFLEKAQQAVCRGLATQCDFWLRTDFPNNQARDKGGGENPPQSCWRILVSLSPALVVRDPGPCQGGSRGSGSREHGCGECGPTEGQRQEEKEEECRPAEKPWSHGTGEPRAGGGHGQQPEQGGGPGSWGNMLCWQHQEILQASPCSVNQV